jgi:hypothetical protein
VSRTSKTATEKVQERRIVQSARAKRTVRTEQRYWLRPAKKNGRCGACGGAVRAGDDIVYRHDARLTLHVFCADADPLIRYRPTAQWEARRARDVKRRAEQARKRAAKTRELA